MRRVPTGIPGLDNIIQGGFPEGSTILVSGGAGTGKTIFALQYVYSGAALYNEPGVFITFEESPKNILWNLQNFGWDYASLNKQGLMKIYRVSIDTPEKFAATWKSQVDNIIAMVKEMGAQRVALDSITALGMLLAEPIVSKEGAELWMGNALAIRTMIKDFSDRLKELDVTSVFTAGTKEDKKTEFSTFGVEEFIVDGVIRLYFIPPRRAIFVRKMRGTQHSHRVHPMTITEKGIEVHANDEILWEALK
ncbi:MAG: hypothetical protein PWP76_293 [Candidatus Diapherotrites archaeon]|nr:hypothetical protein [Candidatus Diapherotrites archaeon]